MPRAIHTLVAEAEREFGALGAAQLAEKIHAKAHRLRMVRECPTPLDLAARFDLGLVRTPALELINQRLLEAMRTRDGRLVISVPPQEGKLIDDRHPVPTPGGWTTHGQLRVGDYVFHPSGKPVRVVAVHRPGFASMVVRTTDHGSVTVHPNHEWTVYDRSIHAWRTVDTRYLASQQLRGGPVGRGGRFRFQLPFREALALPDADLPIDPYTLGVWLGDGSSAKAAITHHPADEYLLAYPESAKCVHAQTGIVTTYYRGGFHSDLRRAGVLGHKHIPPSYLRGSEKQRRALLAGLIDTDGHVSASGQVSFDNADERLVRDASELLRTLGYRAHVHRPTAPKLSSSGIQGIQPMWRVTYTPHDEGPARLTRKAATKLGIRRRVAISDVTECDPVSGRCVTVDSTDGLYLVGEQFTPTHNSNLVQWAIAHRLLDNPEGRIGYASYAASLARRGGRIVRGRVEANLVPGLRIAWDHRDASDWEIAGHRGGMYSVGVEGSLTGRPIDEGLVIDDPIKDLQDAESAAVLGYLMDWWETVAQTRIHPGAWVVVVQTRWAENDLAGRLIGEGWPYVNIPAQAEHGIPDALNRPAGEYLTSVLGRTPDDWLRKRGGVGERTWFALYQGVPSPPKGDIFNEDWFDRDRVTQRPLGGSPPVVVIDPADNTGSGDEAGIIVASSDATQRIYLGPDYSDHYTVGRWVRVALLAVARHDASGLVFEQSLSGLPRSIKTGWDQLRKQALVLHRLAAAGPIDPVLIEVAVTELAHRDDPDTTWEQYRQELIELWPLVAAVLRFTPAGPMIRRIKPQGSKEWRAKAASPSYEQRRVSHVGKLPQLEHQMVTWQPGQKSPDRMDAAVHAILLLSGASAATLATPTGPALPTRSTRLAANRGAALPRSTLIRR